jgi:hypothetical protein
MMAVSVLIGVLIVVVVGGNLLFADRPLCSRRSIGKLAEALGGARLSWGDCATPVRADLLSGTREIGQEMMMMRAPLIFAAIIGLSASAFAQTAVPKAGVKPHKQPPAPMGCKLVGAVKGTKIWAGDCAPPPEIRGSTPAEPTAAPAAPPEAPDKQ